MNNVEKILSGLQVSGRLDKAANLSLPTPLPKELVGLVRAKTAMLSNNIAGTLPKQDWQTINDNDPEVARNVLMELQGSVIPMFPMGGFGG